MTTVTLHGGSSGSLTFAIAMKSIQLRPPEPFNFKTLDEWPRWCKGFQQFRVVSHQAWPARQRISKSARSCTAWEKRQRWYSLQRTRRRTTVRTSQSRARSTPSSMFAETSYLTEHVSTAETSSRESLRSST